MGRAIAPSTTPGLALLLMRYFTPLHDVARAELLQLRRELDRDKGPDIGF